MKYLAKRYGDILFTGVGIPYNEKLITLDEIGFIGKKLYEIDPKIQVCALDYRPEFERLDVLIYIYFGKANRGGGDDG